MEREDNAVQRRVADLKAAGLSPTLAAGSSASATPVHAGTAPQYEVGTNPKLEAAMFKEQMAKDRMALAMTLVGNIADVSRTRAETEMIKAKTGEQDIINSRLAEILEATVVGRNLQNDSVLIGNKFAEASNPIELERMNKMLNYLDRQIEGIGFDNVLKHNEILRSKYADIKAEFEAQLVKENVNLTKLRAENVDFDTALKAYTLTYAVEHKIPLNGLNDWQVVYQIIGEFKNWLKKPSNAPTPNYNDTFNADNYKDANGKIDMMKLLQLFGS